MLIALEPLSFPVAADPRRARVRDPVAVRQPRGARGAPARPRGRRAGARRRSACSATSSATRRASCTRAPGWCPSAARLGIWLVGEAGALLVRPGGRRVDCWCVKVDADAALRRPHGPPPARAARGRGRLRHGGQPRLQRRRLARPRRPARMRPALDAARAPRLERPRPPGCRTAAPEYQVLGPYGRGPRGPDHAPMTSSSAAAATRRLDPRAVRVARRARRRDGPPLPPRPAPARGPARRRRRAVRARQALVRLGAGPAGRTQHRSTLSPSHRPPRGGSRRAVLPPPLHHVA